MNWNPKILFLVMFLALASCGGKKKIAQRKEKQRMEQARNSRPTTGRTGNAYASPVEDYITLYGPIAQEEMRLYHIPASITLAQGILESGAGNSDLTRRANNHFGIKCHDWKGAKVYHDDDRRQECFRKYKDPKYSFRDHSLFLTERKRYAALFDLKADDYRAWAKGLRTAGYATDRKYPTKLVELIERYQLYTLDADVLGNEKIVYQENTTGAAEVYRVKKGDTLYSISTKFNLTVKELQRYNQLNGTTISVGQDLYLQPLNKF